MKKRKMEKVILVSRLKEKCIKVAIYISCLFLLLPNVISQGLIKNLELVGDPFYTSRIKQFSLFSFDLAQLYVLNNSINEGKAEIFSLSELLMSKINLILNVGASNLYIISSILIVFLILLVFEKILKEFKVSNKLAIITVVICLFLLWGPYFPYSLERPISPQVIILIWVIYLHLCIIGIKRTSTQNSILMGLIAGISLYLHYPYLFLQIQVGTICFIILMYCLKIPIKGFVASVIISLILSVPAIFWSLRARQLNEYQELLLRGGLITNHIPSAINTLVIGIIALVLFNRILQRKPKPIDHRLFIGYLFFCSHVIANIALANSNFITGVSLQFSDHFEVFVKVLLVIAIVLFLNQLTIIKGSIIFTRKKQFEFFLSISLLVLSISYIKSVSNQENYSTTFQKEIDLIKERIPANAALILDDNGIADIGGALLTNPLLTNTNIMNYAFSQKEINQRYFANSGCTITQIDNTSYSHMYGFRVISEERKLERVYQFLKQIDLFDGYKESLSKKIDLLNLELDMLKAQIQNDFAEVSHYGCIKFIKDRNIQFIISQKPNKWNSYSKNGEILFIDSLSSLSIYRVN